jgi:hypothetical protein
MKIYYLDHGPHTTEEKRYEKVIVLIDLDYVFSGSTLEVVERTLAGDFRWVHSKSHIKDSIATPEEEKEILLWVLGCD